MAELDIMAMRDLLLQHIEEDPTQYPLFAQKFNPDGTGGPFSAPRLNQLKMIATHYGLDFPGDVRKDNLVRIMNTAWIQDKFPKVTKQSLAQQVAREMSPEMLRAVLAEKEGAKAAEPVAEPKPADEVMAMDWNELREYAKSQGVSVKDGKRFKNRDELLTDLV